MNSADREFVMHTVGQSDLAPDESVRLQKLGDAAFDLLEDLIERRALNAEGAVTALRRLSLLTRQQCQERKEQLLQLAVRLCADDEPVVRSAAVNMAINTLLILERLRIGDSGLPSIRTRVQEAVKAALGRGLDAEQASYVEDFVASRI
jgi:hypothetical protein